MADTIPFGTGEVDRVVRAVASHQEEWRALSVEKKRDMLRDMIDLCIAGKDEMTAAADKVRGWDGSDVVEGVGGFLSCVITVQYLKSLLWAYEGLARDGRLPDPEKVERDEELGVTMARVAPVPSDRFARSAGAFTELWGKGDLGVDKKRTLEPEPGTGGCCAVLFPGNFDGPIDALHQLFIEGNVVVAKLHPVNGPSMATVVKTTLKPLLAGGFLGVVNDELETGTALVQHELVAQWMLTGSAGAFNAIHKLRPDTPYKAELGACSPWIVLSGRGEHAWTDKEVANQAINLVGAKLVSSGHVCASPQILVIDKRWDKKQLFIDEVRKAIAECDMPPHHYPGTEKRLREIEAKAGDGVETITSHSDEEFLLVTGEEGVAWLERNEAFGPVLAVKEIDGDDFAGFAADAVEFANERAMGSLSCTVIVPPKLTSHKVVRTAIRDLRWGVVSVNRFAVFAAMEPLGRWGAPPGRHTPEAIESGDGTMGNVLRLSNVEKAVIFAPFWDQTMQRPAKKGVSPFLKSLVTLAMEPGVGNLVAMLWNKFWYT